MNKFSVNFYLNNDLLGFEVFSKDNNMETLKNIFNKYGFHTVSECYLGGHVVKATLRLRDKQEYKELINIILPRLTSIGD